MAPRTKQPDAFKAFAESMLIFAESVNVPTSLGDVPFGKVMAAHQREWLEGWAPVLQAICYGDTPDTLKLCRKFFHVASKGAGKDQCVTIAVLWLLMFSKRPLVIQVAAADQDNAAELNRTARFILFANPWIEDRVKLNRNSLVCTATNTEAEIIPCDVAGSHGARPNLLILNEVSHITKWEFVQNLLDNATKLPHNVTIVLTNEGFVGSEYWRLREISRTSERWKFTIYDRPAPWINPADLAEAERRNSVSRYKRLYFSVPTRDGGDAFDPDDIKAAVNPSLAPMDGRESGYSFCAGLDLGVKHDHSALVVLAAHHESRRVRVASVQTWAPRKIFKTVDLEAVEQAVLDARRRYNLSRVCYDPHQAALMAQRLQRQGVQMSEMPFVGKNLDLMATTLLETFRSKTIDLFECDRLITDLQRLTIVEKSFGMKLESISDADGHADSAIALAVALPTAVTLVGQPRVLRVDHAFWRDDGGPISQAYGRLGPISWS